MSTPPRKPWWRFIWPAGLAGQIIILIILTILISQTINIILVAGERADAFRRGAAGPLIGQISIAAELLQNTDGPTEQRLLIALGSAERRLTIDAEPLARSVNSTNLTKRLETRLQQESGLTARVEARFIEKRFQSNDDDREARRASRREPRGDRDRPRTGNPDRLRPMQVDRLIVSLELSPGRWLNTVLRLPGRDLDWLKTSLFYNIALALILCAIAIWFLRRVTRPMKDLTIAADALGRGEDVPPLAETGPREIRLATSAFNAMQNRLTRFVKDRTQMLAAISHDLRTPITSLRLRAELLDDETARDNMIRTLDEMQSMTESVLAFARDDAANEPISQVDVLSLLDECASIFRAQGKQIDFTVSTTSTPLLRGRPLSLKRAINNLLENAILYGKRANISVGSKSDSAFIEIRDNGPGIPPDRMEDMFKPFARLETSRNRETGGTGLGLSIARSIIHGHGGEIRLQNATEGGLIVTVDLPLAP
ncbi:MAG: ATP-binding protein [Hyphomicrobiales bacterium]